MAEVKAAAEAKAVEAEESKPKLVPTSLVRARSSVPVIRIIKIK